jgi:hypothetical protein
LNKTIIAIVDILVLFLFTGCDPALRLRYYAVNDLDKEVLIKYSIPKYDYKSKKEYYIDTALIVKSKDTIPLYSQNRIGTISQSNKYCDIIPKIKAYVGDSLILDKTIDCSGILIDTVGRYISTGGELAYILKIGQKKQKQAELNSEIDSSPGKK